MNSQKTLFIFFKKYILVYIILLLYLFDGWINNFAIILSSFYIFFYLIIKKEYDLYLLFLLLLPCIAIGSYDSTNSVLTSSSSLRNINTNFILGPIVISTSFFAALAIPIKLLIELNKNKNKNVLVIWFISLILAILGLFISYFKGFETPSGLTVGFRISLTFGVFFLKSHVNNQNLFYKFIDYIIFTSFFLLCIGFLNGHWLFVIFGFFPYLFHRLKYKIFIIFIFPFTLKYIVGVDSTITILGTFFLSFLLFITVINYKIKNNFLYVSLIFLPILITFYVISLQNVNYSIDTNSLGSLIKFKIVGDRKPIWDASFQQIINSSFFIGPSGSILSVYFDYLNQWLDWYPGSHNIFLEIGRQLGLFSMVLYIILMLQILFQCYLNVKSRIEFLYLFCSLSVFVVYGLTGNSLIYDGVGFFFWLLLNQFYWHAVIKSK